MKQILNRFADALKWQSLIAAALVAFAAYVSIDTVIETPFGSVTDDTNQYLTPLAAYADGDLNPTPEPYREFLYPWITFKLFSGLIEPGEGWLNGARSRVLFWLAVTQVTIYWFLVALVAWSIRTATSSHFPVAVFLSLVAFDGYEYQWISTAMSEAPSKIVFLVGLFFCCQYARTKNRAALALGALSIGLCAIFRSVSLAFPLSIAGAAILYWLTSYFKVRLRWVLSVVCLLLAPTIIVTQIMGNTTGFYGVSPISAWLLAGRVLSVTPPEDLLAAGVDESLVNEIARPLYVGTPGAVRMTRAVHSDIGERTIIDEARYPLPYKDAIALAEQWQLKRGLPRDRFIASELLKSLAVDAMLANPMPMITTSLDLWQTHALVPFWRNLTDTSKKNNLRTIFYVSIIISFAYLIAYRRRETPSESWIWWTAALFLIPGYSLIFSVGQNYNPKYGNHPYFYLGAMSFMAVYSKWLVIEALDKRTDALNDLGDAK